MSSGRYESGSRAFARGELIWKASGGSAIKVVLIDSADYTVNLSTHGNLSDVALAARVATGTLTLIDPAGAGVLDANNVTLTAVTGDPSEALILYLDTGVEATSTLIAYIDGITVTPNGLDIVIAWDNGANKVMAL